MPLACVGRIRGIGRLALVVNGAGFSAGHLKRLISGLICQPLQVRPLAQPRPAFSTP